MGGVPTEEPKTPDPSETEIPHKEEEKPQEQAKAKEDKGLENQNILRISFGIQREVSRPKSLVTLIVNYKNNSLWVNTKLKEYDVTSLEDVEDDDELKTYFLDWAKENKPTQAAFDNLVNKFKELSIAQKRQIV